jgi:hypothetical protein
MDLKPLMLVERIIIWIVTRIVLIRETVRCFQRPKNQRPTFSKSYACGPKLKNRVFLPPGLDLKLKDDKKYPLFIKIHGGGFVAGAPFIDDEYCANVVEKMLCDCCFHELSQESWSPISCAVGRLRYYCWWDYHGFGIAY